MKKYLVGIDEGTTGCKSCVFDFEGHVLASAYKEYGLIFPVQGHVEQDPVEIRDKLFESCAEAIEKAGINSEEIAAMGLSTQAAVTGMLNADGNVIGNFMGWQDLRGWTPEITEELFSKITAERICEATGHPIRNTGVIRRYIWLKNNKPEIWSKVAQFCTQQDYFLKQFGADDYVTDISSAGRYLLADIDQKDWFDDMLEVLEIHRDQLPKIAQTLGQQVGQIPEKVAVQTGLPVGCPICVGGHDQNCGVVGAGSIGGGTVVMTLGTLGTCALSTKQATRHFESGIVVNGDVSGGYSVEVTARVCASALRWFRDTFCQEEVSAAQVCGIDPYNLITDCAKKAPIDSNGIRFIPMLNGSGINQQERGSFVGISLATQKSDICRAVIEGIGCMMKEILVMQEDAGLQIGDVHLAGGLSKSRLVCQMYANIFDKTIHIPESPESACLGAALLAGTGVGVYEDISVAVAKSVRYKATYHPEPEMVIKYADTYKAWIRARHALTESYY